VTDSLPHRRRRFFPNLQPLLSDETLGRIKTRRLRVRFHYLRRLGRPLRILFFLGLLVGLSWLAIVQLKHLFFSTSYLELKSVHVEGLERLDKPTIVRLAGIAPGLNIVHLDRDVVRERISAHPRVRTAHIGLQGLTTVLITVSERAPMLYAKVGTTFYEVSDDGVILSTDGFGDLDLPIITGLGLENKRAGDLLAEHDGFLEARTWVRHLQPSVLAQISEINFASPGNPYIYLLSGVRVIPKSLEDLAIRFDFLRALLDNLRKNNVEPDYLDMRAPSEIVVKPRRMVRIPEGGR
jgi:cell division septal protein FtsQ